MTADRSYRIDVKGASNSDDGGNLANAGLTLYDASGTAIPDASNDRGGIGNNARYVHRAAVDGTIYIEARDDNGAGVGTYTVALTDVTDENISEPAGQDFGDSASSPGHLLFGGSLTGLVDRPDDRDAFRVDLTAGEYYSIDLKGEGTGDGTLPNPYLVLNSLSGEVASNDDISRNDNNARISYIVPTGEGGSHTIVATSTASSYF